MRPTQLHVGGVLRWVINTRNPDTMLLKDADATPTIAVRKNGSAVGDSVTITKRAATTGVYDCEYNPAGEVEGDQFTIRESAQVTGTTTAQATYEFSWPFIVVALERGTDGANTVAPDNATIATIDTRTSNIYTVVQLTDADVSSIKTTVEGLVAAIWSHATRTLTAISDSSGITTLLARITALLETKSQADTRQAALISAIEGIEGGGGSVSVNVLPAVGIVADRSPGVTLKPKVGETINQAITVYATDGTTPINLSGKTLAIVFETMQGVDVSVVPNGSITVSGTSNNVVTFAYPSTVTSQERTLKFALRDAAAPLTMYLQGICNVTKAPQVDA